MRNARRLAVASLGFVLGATFAPEARSEFDPASAGRLVGQYCQTCHSDGLKTAGLSLEGVDFSNIADHAGALEKTLRKVRSGDMPPTGAPEPTASESKAFTKWLEEGLDRAALENVNPGRPDIHRLNRAEYSNAIRDLLDLDIDPGNSLPADDSGFGFDNIAGLLSVSPVRLERYLSVAGRVSRLAVGNPDVKPFRDLIKRNRETAFLKAGLARNVLHDLPFGSGGGTSLRYYFPVDAEYVVTVDLGGDGGSHELRLPIRAGVRTLVFSFPAESTKPEVAVPALGSRGGNGVAPAPMDVRLDGARVKLVEMAPGSAPSLASIAIAGPYEVEGPGDTPSRRKIFSCQPSTKAEEEPCARRIFSRLARYAYRRPVDEADISALMSLYQIGRQDGDFERGVEKALQAMLISPSFLFRVERDPAGLEPGSAYRLSDVELASRLSFFLWSSIPDEELLSLAEQGRLSEPAVLAAQTRRMLADRRSQALVSNFAGQWLYLRNVDTAKPDSLAFPDFDAELRWAMRRETELFFETVLREDRRVVELLDADYTFLNERLARHYGIAGVNGPQFRRVALNDPNRGGLVGQASLLTVTSYPNRTSVVLRGKWLLENLFGMPPPAPPPDVPALEEKRPDGKPRTMREAMQAHSVNPTCAGCHSRMDPLGFALENFDAVGRWRDEDAGSPIDATGTFPNGVHFQGPAELKGILVDQYQEDFVATVAERLLTYAVGRGVEYYDKPAIRSIARAGAGKGHRLSDLVSGVVASTPFRMRRARD